VHKGPIDLSNLYDTYTNPTYNDITFEDANSAQNVHVAQSENALVNIPIAEHITQTVNNGPT
jgi:hypothetical protein